MLAASAFQSADLQEEIDTFVPVPLHWTRRLKRGYNQTLLLASKISEPDKIVSDELVRIRRTRRQSDYISFAKRRKNVEGAFALRSDHCLTGKTVCLVDDVKTTGATLNECSRVLKQAGVAKVYGLVLAVAGQNPY
jgi:ComF family protein